jgi:hypothetical protein
MTREEELHPDLAACLDDSGHFPMVKHPLLFQKIHDARDRARANSLYEKKKEEVREAIHRGDFGKYIALHERPCRVQAILSYPKIVQVSDAEYWKEVSEVWQDSESVGQNRQEWEALWSSDRPEKHLAMSDEEREELANLPDPITVYRGCPESGLDDNSLSWTLSRETAEWFARRYSLIFGPGAVLEGQVRKSDVHVLLLGRDEQEIISSRVITTGSRRVVDD